MSIYSEEEFKEIILKKKYSKLKWSQGELLFKNREKRRKKILVENIIPLSLYLHVRVKLSCFGRFFKTFNEDQAQNYFLNENKLGIEEANIKIFNSREKFHWDYYHNFSENLFELLKLGVETQECIDYQILYDNLIVLRLIDGPANYFDSLLNFSKLQILIVSANWIKEIPGKYLPRTLYFLECFANEIENIRPLCTNPPKRLKYLGLGRNLLTSESGWHLLVKSRNFAELKILDISNNNIVCVVCVLQYLKKLYNLLCLALEGNPCWACVTYKECIFQNMPRLIYLDNTEILEEDKKIEKYIDFTSDAVKGSLIFTCYRLLNLPPPPKGKVIHKYYLEVELPLLEEIKGLRNENLESYTILDDLVAPIVPVIAPEKSISLIKKEKEDKKDKKGKNKNAKKDTKSKQEKKNKKQKATDSKTTYSTAKEVPIPVAVEGVGLYALPDESEKEKKRRNFWFKTEERPWSRNLKFNYPAVVVKSPNDDLTLLRDTFRTKVKVKIMYVQKLRPSKKKGKKGKKNKQQEEQPGEESPPKEIILKKCTFATFYCDLHPINWSDECVDFIWADSPHFTNSAVTMEGTLRPQIYEIKKKKNKNLIKNETPTNSEIPTETEFQYKKYPMPKVMTCHVGFGLMKYNFQEEIIPIPVKKERRRKR